MNDCQALAVNSSTLAQPLTLNCEFDYGRFPSRQNITLAHSNQLSLPNHHHLTITSDSISCYQSSIEKLPKLELPFSPYRQSVTGHCVHPWDLLQHTQPKNHTCTATPHVDTHTLFAHTHSDKHTHIPQLCMYVHSTKLSTKLFFVIDILHLKAYALISASPCLDTGRSLTNIYRCNQPLFKSSFNFLKTLLRNLSLDGLRTLGFQVFT